MSLTTDEIAKISNNKELFEFLVGMGSVYFCSQEQADELVADMTRRFEDDMANETMSIDFSILNVTISKNSIYRLNSIINTQPLIRKALETNQFMVSDLNLYHQDIPNFYKRFHFFTGTDKDIRRIAERKLAVWKIEEVKSQDPSMKTVVKDAIAKVESRRNNSVLSLLTLAAASLPESKTPINSSLEEAEVIRAEAASSRYNAL